jgi:phosphoribosylformylglycinamidine synthase
MEKIVHYYRKTEPSHSLLPSVKEELKALGLVDDSAKIQAVETESCFNVKLDADLTQEQTQRLEWLLAETFERDGLRLEKSVFDLEAKPGYWKAEFGPRMTFTSAFSSNASSICQACGLPITRLELSRRYRFLIDGELSEKAVTTLKLMLHDRMTEEEYTKALTSFDSGATAKPVKTVPIMKEGRAALESINKEMGLGFDDFDLDYYTNLFQVSFFLWNRLSKVLSGDSTHPDCLVCSHARL